MPRPITIRLGASKSVGSRVSLHYFNFIAKSSLFTLLASRFVRIDLRRIPMVVVRKTIGMQATLGKTYGTPLETTSCGVWELGLCAAGFGRGDGVAVASEQLHGQRAGYLQLRGFEPSDSRDG